MSCPSQSLSALGGNHRLREIVLSGCENITDLGLQKFAQQCRDIERLDISFCHVSGQFVDRHLYSIEKVQVRLVLHMYTKHQLTRQTSKNLGDFIFLFCVYFWKVQHLPTIMDMAIYILPKSVSSNSRTARSRIWLSAVDCSQRSIWAAAVRWADRSVGCEERGRKEGINYLTRHAARHNLWRNPSSPELPSIWALCFAFLLCAFVQSFLPCSSPTSVCSTYLVSAIICVRSTCPAASWWRKHWFNQWPFAAMHGNTVHVDDFKLPRHELTERQKGKSNTYLFISSSVLGRCIHGVPFRMTERNKNGSPKKFNVWC